MTVSRRDFLKAGGLSAAALMLASCSQIGREFARHDLPDSLNIPAASPPIVRLLNRAGYGARPGELEYASQLGLAGYLEAQLDPAAITDTTCDMALRNLTYYPMDITQLLAQEPRDVAYDFGQSTISRALYSKRQIYESMVEFWTDHFNIYIQKNKHMLFLKVVDDREVIRPNALGKFRDLLWASAHSPAMLVYLDNVQNTKAAPNENYARELMELHTLGVHGGYTQQDVQELSRALTGWQVQRRGRQQGQFFFNNEQHDDGEKVILGVQLPAGQGQHDVEQMLDVLVTHPMTAQFIAMKLVRRFVADDPPKGLIERVAAVYTRTDGDIKMMLREVFLSEEFANAPPKLKRPYTYLISTLRSMGVDLGPKALKSMTQWLNRMGQPLYQWPPPDGYPDTAPAWASNLLPRWNFALNLLSNQIDGAHVPFDQVLTATNTADVESALNAFALLTLGQALDEKAAELFSEYVGMGKLTDAVTKRRIGDVVSLMLASPAFQWM